MAFSRVVEGIWAASLLGTKRVFPNVTLVDGRKEAGVQRVTWNGDDDRGNRVASGVYFHRMTAPGFEMTKKMVLLQ